MVPVIRQKWLTYSIIKNNTNMRTLPEITSNISLISTTMRGLKSQIDLLDNEYQKAAIENTGEPYEGWTEMREKLQTAWDSLNQLWHMEADLESELKHPETEEEDIYDPDSDFYFTEDVEAE